MKNPCSKTVRPENAYEVWEGNGWTWKVLKKYQMPETEAKNPMARWFCFVTSPYCPSGEYGDVYVSEIKQSATLTKTNKPKKRQTKTFDEWYEEVNKYIEQKLGVTSEDLPDYMYMEEYENGAKAYDVAMAVIRENT